jgi:hypothetical protein
VIGTHAGVTNLNIAPRHRVKREKVYKDLPSWLINYESNIDLDGWLHWEVHGNGRIDKVSKPLNKLFGSTLVCRAFFEIYQYH